MNILKLSSELRSLIQKKDRCLLISENRPEWMVSDLAIMLAGGITVPAYTTYTERDYEYLIDDCNPSVIIVSDQVQYNKIKNYSCIQRVWVIISKNKRGYAMTSDLLIGAHDDSNIV